MLHVHTHLLSLSLSLHDDCISLYRYLVERPNLRHLAQSYSLRARIPREHFSRRSTLGTMTSVTSVTKSRKRFLPTCRRKGSLMDLVPPWVCSRWHFPPACRGKGSSHTGHSPQDGRKATPWGLLGASCRPAWEHCVPACPSHSRRHSSSQAWSALATFVLFGQTPNAPVRENGKNMSKKNEVHDLFLEISWSLLGGSCGPTT